jgi:protoporphyrinogen oxidase
VTPEALEARAGAARRLPSPRAGHADLVRRIDGLLAGERLLLTGNWFGGLAIEDCLARSAAEAERLAALG